MEGTYPRRCGGGGRAGSPAGGVSSAQLAAFGRAAGGEGELEEERERQGGEVTVLVCLSVPLVGRRPHFLIGLAVLVVVEELERESSDIAA